MSNEKTNNWKDAPSWATHRAIDADGVLYYYSSEPKLGDVIWRYGAYVYGRKYFAGYADATNWRESLERRPEPQRLSDLKSADMENDPNMDYAVAATFGPAQDKEPVTWEWLESLIPNPTKCYQKDNWIVIILTRGAYNYDLNISKNIVSLVDMSDLKTMVVHNSVCHGNLTREKVLQIISVFS